MTTSGVRVYLCECGPIIGGALDLDRLAERVGALPDVAEVVRYATLCSHDGKAWLADELRAHPEQRVVIAACSPREHGETFAAAARAAGVNPYLLALASIREQAAWVTPDREAALDKADRLIRAAIRRVLAQEPLPERDIDAVTDVLVLGSGVAGLTAAKLLAQADRQVVLVDSSPAIGGRAALLSDIYPGYECASCILEPLMDEVLHHPSVELHTASELVELLGFLGNFTARIRRRARPVNPELCYGCHTCHEACPVSVPNPLEGGLSERKAIHVPYTGALPNVSIVDEEHCLRYQGQECDACVTTCPFGAIDFSATEELVERRVGAVVVATGATADLSAAWRAWPRVIDTSTLERLMSSAGPTGGVIRLSEDHAVGSVALVFDPGEGAASPEDVKLRRMTMNKALELLHRKLPQAELHELLWTSEAEGGGAEGAHGQQRHWLRAGDGISGVEPDGDGARLRFTRGGRPEELRVDLIVVAPPWRGATGNATLGGRLGIETTPAGFFTSEDPILLPYRAPLDGLYVAGCARGPMDIGESCAAAAASAGGVLSALVPGRRLALTPTAATVDEGLCGSCHTCTLACPYQAVRMDPETGLALVNELLCRGCGCCAAACPSGAIRALHFTDDQLRAELEALLEDAPAPANDMGTPSE